MSARHSLALPLSAEYAHDVRDGFSFFTTAAGTVGLHPTVETYLDDLCAFFRAARLIMAHPDNYFQFMRGETWAASAVHFDGSPVEAAELRETQRLLSGFAPLLNGDDAMTKLRTLVRDGPPAPPPSPQQGSSSSLGDGEADATPAAATPLHALNSFYQQTRRLMLGRARRPTNDAATVTLLSPAASAAADRHSAHAQAEREHQAQILELVVSHGMNPKKQHEVRIMRDTIHDLVACCNAELDAQSREDAEGFDDDGRPVSETLDAHGAVRVETAINIGEGKGYVSRAVALCDNLQVIGLDCNPAHKERAVERIESLLETSLSSRDGRPRVNLLYEPRGHVASIACRVEAAVNWSTLLQGHVLTRDDTASSHCSRCCTSTGHDESAEVRAHAESGEEDDAAEEAVELRGASTHESANTALAVLSTTRGEETVKLACRVCGKVVRLENTTVIMKHVYTHLHSAPREANELPASSSFIPSAAQLHQWNLSLSQHAYVAKLTETFFTVADVEARHHDHRKDAAQLKRPRDGDVTDASVNYLTLSRVQSASLDDAGNEESDASASPTVTLQPTYTARGYRAVLLLARAVSETNEVSVDGQTNASSALVSSSPSPPSVPVRWVYAQQRATIVGYDGGVDCHQVCLDGECKKRVLRLYRLPASPNGRPQQVVLGNPSTANSPTPPSLLGEWQLPDPAVWGEERVAVVLAVLPPALPSTPVVCVPSVRNTVLIGLHPCGDLGSNVCRIFTNSAARGLLLVSCCWHSLTPEGFPLSRALRQRGMTTNSVSLLLATQPLDAWSTASPEGHRSSAKLLFYRSLFKLLWARLAREWADGPQQMRSNEGNDGCSDEAHAACAFPAPPPHLEPVFLRRMSRQKDTITFSEFMEAIAAEYLYTDTAKSTPYTPWNIGFRCAACRDAQEAFVRAALTTRALPQEMTTMFEGEHFAQFLGLTVLRMWMCHLVESLLLLDRALYLHEELCLCGGDGGDGRGEASAVSLVPLFDGALSPRMYGILARRGGSA